MGSLRGIIFFKCHLNFHYCKLPTDYTPWSYKTSWGGGMWGAIHRGLAGLSLRLQVAGYLLLVAREVASSHGAPPPPLPEDVFEVQLLPFSKRHYRPKKAIFIKSTAIISGFTMITSLLKKTTTF